MLRKFFVAFLATAMIVCITPIKVFTDLTDKSEHHTNDTIDHHNLHSLSNLF